MTPVLIAVVAVAAVVLSIVSARHALAERDAVERGRRALDMLGAVADRANEVLVADSPPVRPRRSAAAIQGAAIRGAPVVRGPGPPLPDPTWAAVPGQGAVRRRNAAPGRGVVPDPRAARRGARLPVTEAVSAGPTVAGRGAIDAADPAAPYQPRHRKARSRRRPGRWTMVAVVSGVVAVALVGVGIYTANRGRAPTSPGARSAPTTTTPARPGSTAAPSTTVGAPVVLVSSDDQHASYRVNDPSANVELVAHSPCWVEITSGTGPVAFAATMRAGSRHVVPTVGAASGGISVQLGNPAGMSISVDGTTLVMPVGIGTKPFTLRFQPS